MIRKGVEFSMIEFINKNYIRIAFLIPVVTLLTLTGMSATGCDNNDVASSVATSRRQIDKLARPAIAEGLILSDTAFQAWHEARPDQETGTAALGEMVKTLSAIHFGVGLGVAEAPPSLFDFAGTSAPSDFRIDTIVRNLMPDLMRINTDSPSGYAVPPTGAPNAVVGSFGSPGGSIIRPTGGRLLEDDVIDITMTMLTNVDGVGFDGVAGFNGDSVPYIRTPADLNTNGNDTNTAIGHQPLPIRGGTVQRAFPFLAPPQL